MAIRIKVRPKGLDDTSDGSFMDFEVPREEDYEMVKSRDSGRILLKRGFGNKNDFMNWTRTRMECEQCLADRPQRRWEGLVQVV